MAFFCIDGGQIHYEGRGGGSAALVLVHGLACALDDWRYQVSHFAPSTRVICLDQRGHGQSRGHASGFDIATFGADLAALVRALELPPAVLVGHSFGCRVVLECTRRFPQAVAGVVLIDGSRLATRGGDDAHLATRNAMRDSGYDAFFERLFTQMFTPASDPAIRDEVIARAMRLPRAVGLELTPAMVAWDAECIEDALESVQVPLKIIQSTYLNESRERVSLRPGETTPWLDLVRTRVPSAEIEIVPGVGHFTMIEAADAVNRHIADLLAHLDGMR